MDVNVNEINQFLTNYHHHAGAGTHPHDGAPHSAQSVADYGYDETQSQSMTDYDSDETQSMTVRSSNAPSVFTHKSHRTFISSAPSRRSHQQAQGQFLTRVPGFNGRNQFLWCEFSELLDCRATFRLDDEPGWVQHHLNHLQNDCPMESMCWFCDRRFTADHSSNAYAVFWDRMEHIRQDIREDPNLTAEVTRPDYNLVHHIRRSGLLPEATYQHAIEFDELPEQYRLPGSSSSSSRPTGRPTREQGQYVVATSSERRRGRDPNRERRRERHGKTYA